MQKGQNSVTLNTKNGQNNKCTAPSRENLFFYAQITLAGPQCWCNLFPEFLHTGQWQRQERTFDCATNNKRRIKHCTLSPHCSLQKTQCGDHEVNLERMAGRKGIPLLLPEKKLENELAENTIYLLGTLPKRTLTSRSVSFSEAAGPKPVIDLIPLA